ncbi:cell surface protein [Loigolactobacillus binensis]|uniref:Cell surface protein n=1 Tax=Loigolactobacillus binensis TaxID=2559922 RepID=A0ABW3ECY8_9LACO|nr:cell surface protein [Loigolactobacillus binensis]
MGKRMWRRSLSLLAVLSVFLGIVLSSARAAATTQSVITLSGIDQMQVGESKTLVMTLVKLPATTIKLTLPAGLKFDAASFEQQTAATQEQISVQEEQGSVLLTTHTVTTAKINLPLLAVKAGDYRLQAVTNTFQSNQQAIAVTAANETTTAVAEATTTSDDGTTTKQADATVPTVASPAVQAASSIALKVDQAAGSGIVTNNYYGGDYQVSGTVWDNTSETLSFYAVMTKISGNGATPVKEQLLGTVKMSSNVTQNWQFAIPDSYLPDVTVQSAGSLYRMRIEARQSTTNFGSGNFQLAYIQGNLGITAPSTITFGNNLSVNETQQLTYLGKIASGDQALTVVDTRTFPASSTLNGWQLTVSLAQQMTGNRTGTILTNSLHYLNDGTDYTLSSAASPVASLVTATPGKNTAVSANWNAQNGLAFEPTPGQPQAEQYGGSVIWNLQETPPNK